MTTAAMPVVHCWLDAASLGANGAPGVGAEICVQALVGKPPFFTQSLSLMSAPASTLAFDPTPSP